MKKYISKWKFLLLPFAFLATSIFQSAYLQSSEINKDKSFLQIKDFKVQKNKLLKDFSIDNDSRIVDFDNDLNVTEKSAYSFITNVFEPDVISAGAITNGNYYVFSLPYLFLS